LERQTLQKTQTTRAQSNRVQAKAGDSSAGRHLLTLQTSVGNQAVQRLINSPIVQAKLNAGSPILQRKCDHCEGDECAKCSAGAQTNGPLEEDERKSDQERSLNQPVPTPAEAPSAAAPSTPPVTSGENPPVPADKSTVEESGRSFNVPAETYLLPYDRSPQAAPGERIIFFAMFNDPTPNDYQLEYSTTGGHFDSAAGPTTKTIAGLTANLNFHVPTPWTGAPAVQVVFKLRKISNNTVVRTETWNFSLKKRYPTTMAQVETTGERNMPADYSYNIGPALLVANPPYYQHQTILERFGTWSLANIAPADIKGAYRTQHSLNSTAAITSHFLGPTDSGFNGTFTVDANDQIFDRHDGTYNVSNLVANLVAPKDIEIALPQFYEAKPGTTLGSYTVTRVRKVNGTWKVKKG
jgi:hypothetical protein